MSGHLDVFEIAFLNQKCTQYITNLAFYFSINKCSSYVLDPWWPKPELSTVQAYHEPCPSRTLVHGALF